jgi:hypothetical protein
MNANFHEFQQVYMSNLMEVWDLCSFVFFIKKACGGNALKCKGDNLNCKGDRQKSSANRL